MTGASKHLQSGAQSTKQGKAPRGPRCIGRLNPRLAPGRIKGRQFERLKARLGDGPAMAGDGASDEGLSPEAGSIRVVAATRYDPCGTTERRHRQATVVSEGCDVACDVCGRHLLTARCAWSPPSGTFCCLSSSHSLGRPEAGAWYWVLLGALCLVLDTGAWNLEFGGRLARVCVGGWGGRK